MLRCGVVANNLYDFYYRHIDQGTPTSTKYMISITVHSVIKDIRSSLVVDWWIGY